MRDDNLPLFGESETRRAILVRFFATPGLERHARELARELGRAPQVVGRELDRLERAGILTSQRIGRARRYRIDGRSPIASEVRALVQKTLGVEARLRSALASVPGVEEAFLFGSYARGDDRATSDLDLLVVGAVDQVALSEQLVEVEQELGRDVNVVSYARDELDRLHESGDRFIAEVLAGPRVRLVPVRADG